MKNLVENQELEDQVNLNEQEEIQGGGYSCNSWNFCDDSDSDNVVF